MKTAANLVYRPVDAKGSDCNEYLMLHNLLFKGAAITEEWLKWYHNSVGNIESYSKGTRTYGIYDGNALVGIWSVEPKILNTSEGKQINCGRCFAVGIDPEYRRLGLFVELSKYSISQEKQLGEYEYILGFPQQGRAVVGGHLKAGWNEALTYPAYGLKTELACPRLTRADANVITNFKDIPLKMQSCAGFFESDQYRNMRWLHHPNHHYLCYAIEDSYIVLKPYSNFCHIVDFKGSKDNLQKLFEVVTDICKRHGWVELNLWCADNEIYKDVILKAGFSAGADHATSITMIAVPIAAKVPLGSLVPCHLTMGIEEPY